MIDKKELGDKIKESVRKSSVGMLSSQIISLARIAEIIDEALEGEPEVEFRLHEDEVVGLIASLSEMLYNGNRCAAVKYVLSGDRKGHGIRVIRRGDHFVIEAEQVDLD